MPKVPCAFFEGIGASPKIQTPLVARNKSRLRVPSAAIMASAIQTTRAIASLRSDEISRDYKSMRSLNESSTGSQRLEVPSKGALRCS